MRTLGQYMAGSGATFGLVYPPQARLLPDYQLTWHSFFMSIGSIIRSDASEEYRELYRQAQRRPILLQAHPAWRRDS